MRHAFGQRILAACQNLLAARFLTPLMEGTASRVHHSSNGSGADRSPQFVHPPMLPDTTGTSDGHVHGHGHGMDFLHPPMILPQEEESLFTISLHPPMILPQEGKQVTPPCRLEDANPGVFARPTPSPCSFPHLPYSFHVLPSRSILYSPAPI